MNTPQANQLLKTIINEMFKIKADIAMIKSQLKQQHTPDREIISEPSDEMEKIKNELFISDSDSVVG